MHQIISVGMLALSLLSHHVIASPTSFPPSSSPDSSHEQVYENYGRALIDDHIYGKRNVTYGITANGDVVIEGDLIYGTVEDIEHDASTGGQKLHPRAFSNPNCAFPSTQIKYKYDSDASERKLSADVQEAMKRWQKGAGFLQFQKTSPNSGKNMDKVLTIDAGCVGCKTQMGNGNSFRRIHLGNDCKTGCGADVTTHELGHALGLFHEQTRPDRDTYVRFHCENVHPRCNNMPAGKTCCDEGLPKNCCNALDNFWKTQNPEWDAGGPYDVNSIMHYTATTWAKPNTIVLEGLNGVKVPAKTPAYPTQLDFGRICKLYKKC